AATTALPPQGEFDASAVGSTQSVLRRFTGSPGQSWPVSGEAKAWLLLAEPIDHPGMRFAATGVGLYSTKPQPTAVLPYLYRVWVPERAAVRMPKGTGSGHDRFLPREAFPRVTISKAYTKGSNDEGTYDRPFINQPLSAIDMSTAGDPPRMLWRAEDIAALDAAAVAHAAA